MKMKISLIVSICVFALCFSGVTFTVGAADITITTAEGFSAIGNNATGTYIIANDIDLTTITYTTLTGFGGTLRGANPDNLVSITTNKPLFDTAAVGFKVENIKIKGEIETSATSNIGALFGVVSVNGTVENCVNEANIRATYNSTVNYIGGFVGNNNGGILTINNVINKGNIIAVTSAGGLNGVGGIIGYAKNAQITKAANYGNINREDGHILGAVGGIVGYSISTNGTIKQSFNCGNLAITYGDANEKPGRSIGGILGNLYGSGTAITITDCYNRGSITGNVERAAGGIAGNASGGGMITISKCYNAGVVSGAMSGEIYRSPSTSTINATNCYYLAEETNAVTGALSDADMTNLTNFANFGAEWTIDTNGLQGTEYRYPQIAGWLDFEYQAPEPDGSLELPYLISTPAEFNIINTDPGKYYKLTDSFTLGAALPADGGASFEPFKFSGHLNGNGKTITVYIDKSTTDKIGLFTEFEAEVNSSISSLIVDGKITGNEHVGGIIGYSECDNEKTATITLTNCVNKADIIAKNGRAGGIVGETRGANITFTGCTNYGDILAEVSYAGGITSRSYVLDKCKNFGDVTAKASAAGGITSSANRDITNSYNTGNITAGDTVGGITASSTATRGHNSCYNIGTVKATYAGATKIGGIVGVPGTDTGVTANCYNLGSVMVGDDYVSNPIAPAGVSAGVANCFYLGDDDDDGVDGTTNKSIEEMKALDLSSVGFDVDKEGTFGYPEITGNPQLLTDFAVYKVTITVTGGENGDVNPKKAVFIKNEDDVIVKVKPNEGYYATVGKNLVPDIAQITTEESFITQITENTAITVNFIERTVPDASELVITAPIEVHQYEVEEPETVRNHISTFTLKPGNTYIVTFSIADREIYGWTLEEYGFLLSTTEPEPTVENSASFESRIELTAQGNYGMLFYGKVIVPEASYYTRAYAKYKKNEGEEIAYAYNDTKILETE